MLDGYFDLDGATGEAVIKNRKRLLAVQAALEIAKASAGASGANARTDKVEYDLGYAAKELDTLVKAIEDALSKE